MDAAGAVTELAVHSRLPPSLFSSRVRMMPQSDKTVIQSVSPVDGRPVWAGTDSSPAKVAAAMESAAAGFQRWSQTPVERRLAIVRKFAAVIRDQADALSRLITREVGKLPAEARGEVNASIAKVENTILAFESRAGTQLIEDSDVRRVIRHRPIGVAVVLGPFNFPLHLPGGHILPLLLAGNSVVFKPSEKATAVGLAMIDAWRLAGLPDDVLIGLTGTSTTAIYAINDSRTGGVFLTGSRAAGVAIHRQLAGRPEVQLALELGGNNPVVVCKPRSAAAVAATLTFSAFVSAGQRCTCARRAIFACGTNNKRFIDAVVHRTEKLRVGIPVVSESDTSIVGDQAIDIGPLVDSSAADSFWKTYRQLVRLGCTPLLKPRRDRKYRHLVFPGIVDATDVTSDAWQKIGTLEWFGPLLVVRQATDFDEALQLAKATPYGLSAALLGGTRPEFERFANSVGAGVVNWNRPTTGAAGVLPFGGRGHSGNHRPAGFVAVDACVDAVSSLESSTLPPDPWG